MIDFSSTGNHRNQGESSYPKSRSHTSCWILRTNCWKILLICRHEHIPHLAPGNPKNMYMQRHMPRQHKASDWHGCTCPKICKVCASACFPLRKAGREPAYVRRRCVWTSLCTKVFMAKSGRATPYSAVLAPVALPQSHQGHTCCGGLHLGSAHCP